MQVETLLHRQAGRCFYCRKPLKAQLASIEHVVPQCLGGWEGFTNLVACCRRMNLLLSGLPPKHKIEILLNWQGQSPCPMDMDELCQDVEWVSGKYVYMATCLKDPVYVRLRENVTTVKTSVDVPEDFQNLGKGIDHDEKES
jgi:hypothetical protein